MMFLFPPWGLNCQKNPVCRANTSVSWGGLVSPSLSTPSPPQGLHCQYSHWQHSQPSECVHPQLWISLPASRWFYFPASLPLFPFSVAYFSQFLLCSSHEFTVFLQVFLNLDWGNHEFIWFSKTLYPSVVTNSVLLFLVFLFVSVHHFLLRWTSQWAEDFFFCSMKSLILPA